MDAKGIGEMVKTLREEAGISQAAFALELGVARTTLTNWELGRRQMDAVALSLAAKLLNVDPGVLVGHDRQEMAPGAHERLVKLLQAQGPERAAKILGVTVDAVIAVTYNKLRIPRSSFEDLASAYGISYEWLLTGSRSRWHTRLKGSHAARLRYLRILSGLPIPEDLRLEWDPFEESDAHFRRKLAKGDDEFLKAMAGIVTSLIALDPMMVRAMGSDTENPPVNAWEWVINDQQD